MRSVFRRSGRRTLWTVHPRGVTVDAERGLEVEVVDSGPASAPVRPGAVDAAPAILLLHGIGMTSASLEPLAAELAPAHRTVCVTLPGHGRSRRPSAPLSIEDYAATAAAVLERLGLRDVIAVGQSMGSQFVVELARSRPDLVAGVVAIGPVTDDAHPTAIAQGTALAIDSTRERPTANLLVVRDYLLCGIRWFTANLRPMLDYRIDERAADVRVPATVIRGSRDPIAGPDWVVRLAAAFPDGRAVTLTGPHHVQLVVPRDVAAVVRAVASRSRAVASL